MKKIIEQQEWAMAGHNSADSICITRYYEVDDNGNKRRLSFNEEMDYLKAKQKDRLNERSNTTT